MSNMSLRVTLGYRLGVAPRSTTPPPKRTLEMPTVDTDAVPHEIEPEKVLRLADVPSCPTVPVELVPEPKDGPPRVRGEMVWLHKTAPVLVIEGRQGLSPEEHAAGRRR